MNRYILTALVIIIVILATSLGFFIFQNQKLVSNLASSPSPSSATNKSPAGTPQPNVVTSPTPSPATTLANLQSDIENSINSNNFSAIKTYMTDQVEVILQATECCGPISPTEAQSQLSYVTDGVPLDFDQSNPTIVNLKANNPELSGKFVGISQSEEHLIAIGINNQNLITDIRMSVSWQLFTI